MDGFERYLIVDGPDLRRILLLTNFASRERYSIDFSDGTTDVGIAFIPPKNVAGGSPQPPPDTHFIFKRPSGQELWVPLSLLVRLTVISEGNSNAAKSRDLEEGTFAERRPKSDDVPRWIKIVGALVAAVGITVGVAREMRKTKTADPSSCVENDTKECKTARNEPRRQICERMVWGECSAFGPDAHSFVVNPKVPP
jgi:hypothetical protein